MKRRIGIAACTGLGGGMPAALNNSWTGIEKIDSVIKEMLGEAVLLFFKEYEGADFAIMQDDNNIIVVVGIEPSYKFEHLKTIRISSDVTQCYKRDGIAWGFYGTGIAHKTKTYGEYTRKSKFVRFAEKWSPVLQKLASDYLPFESEVEK